MPTHDIQTSFNGGSISPRLHGRTDAAIYDIALSEMVNFAPTVEGPAIKRSGTQLAGEADAAASALIPFEYNATQSYALEMGDYAARVYANSGAPLTDGGGDQVVVTGLPWSAQEAPDLDWQQSADVLYIAHPSHPLSRISRTGAASFTYSVPTLSSGPFKDQNTDRTITVYASDVTVGASITLTASSAIFMPSHVGGQFQMQALDFSGFKLWQPGMQTVVGDIWRSDGKLYRNINGGQTGSTPPTHTYGSEWDGTGTNAVDGHAYGVLWQYVCDQYGQMVITATGDPLAASDTATATVTRALPNGLSDSGQATWRWNFGRFSDAYGWPKIVRIWNNRLILMTDFEIFGSVVGDYFNFSKFDDTGKLAADLAFYFRINGSNPIKWAAVDLQMLIGTDRHEYTIGPINAAQAASSTNLQSLRQSHYGGAAIRAAQINTKTIFVQRGGRKIREASFDYTQNRYQAPNMVVWCRHLAQAGIARIAYQQESEEILWALRKDGRLLMHAYSPEQQVKGWALAAIAGFDGADAQVLDICAMPSAAGSPDMLWMLIQRGGVKTVEVLADWWVDGTDMAQARFVDGGIFYSGTPATQIGLSGTGFPTSWAGKTIAGLLDGKAEMALTVESDGSVTLPYAASNVALGLFYPAWMVGLAPKLPAQSGGFAEMLRRRMTAMLLRVVDSAALWAGGARASRLSEMLRRDVSARMDQPSPLTNGVSQQISTGGDADREGQWRIESRAPLPAIISLIRATYVREDKD